MSRRFEIIPLPRCPVCHEEWAGDQPGTIYMTLDWTDRRDGNPEDAVRVFPVCSPCCNRINEPGFETACNDAVRRFLEMDATLSEYRNAHADVL